VAHCGIWLPGKLERQGAAAKAHPSVALLFSDCVYIDERGETIGRLSDQYGLAGIDLTGTRAYAETVESTAESGVVTTRAGDGGTVRPDSERAAFQ
jgi:hypothetical protein